MPLSQENEKLFIELDCVLEKIGEFLKASGENPLEYKGLEKVKNISRHRDIAGVKNIIRYLDGDFRVIYDNRLSSDTIEKLMENAYSIADQLQIYRKNKY